MTVLLQHKARIVVVLAMMMVTIGLSGCADTVTGTENVKTEMAVERLVEESPSTSLPAQAPPLSSADSLHTEDPGLIPPRNSQKLVDRF